MPTTRRVRPVAADDSDDSDDDDDDDDDDDSGGDDGEAGVDDDDGDGGVRRERPDRSCCPRDESVRGNFARVCQLTSRAHARTAGGGDATAKTESRW